MREYIVFYWERGNIKAHETRCTVTANNKKEARENFEEWDNQDKKWTITRIEKDL